MPTSKNSLSAKHLMPPGRRLLLKIALAVVFLALLGALVLIWPKPDNNQNPSTPEKYPHIQQVERKSLGTPPPSK